LAGIHSGLLNSKTEQNFIISCDVPLMTKQMIEFICNYKTSKPITLCKAEGFVQQLVGKYSRKILPNVEEILNITDTENQISTQKNKKSSVFTLLDEVDAEIINVEELEFYKDDIFYNMNRKEDYQKIVKLFEK
jgi:molybdopterin-guanine dinucleotide biosynthesis protein A